MTLGALIIIVAIVTIAGAAQLLISWGEAVALIIAFYGCWLIVASAIRARNPSKYERSAFSLFGWGMLLAAIGFGWDLNIRTEGNWLYTLAVVLLLLGILAIVAALKTSSKKV